MVKKNYNILSNSEIRIRLIEMENEYKAIQNRMRENIHLLNEIDKEYTKAKGILDKRTGGINL